MKKFQGKYRIPSARATWWDYSNGGSYFITINTHNREYAFGDIVRGDMALSAIGEIAQQCWIDIPNHFPHVKLGAYQVMPNHIHGILNVVETLHATSLPLPESPVKTLHATSLPPIVQTVPIEQTLHATSLQVATSLQMTAISPKSGSLARILGSYKSAVSKLAHIIDGSFEWQERFHDHIIRDTLEYNRIEYYIIHNPESWDDDCFNL